MPRSLVAILIAAAIATPLAAISAPPVAAGAIHADVPERPDPAARYIVYLHGAWPETHAKDEPHPKRGPFRYDAIVAGLADRGFEVISELRTKPTNPRTFARLTREKIEALIARGVPAKNVTVVGFSKGGEMALIIGAKLRQQEASFAILAGCAKGKSRQSYEKILANDASTLRGRFLSLYDQADRVAGTCREAFAKTGVATVKEEVLKVGKGHGTFYEANRVWLDRVSDFARGKD